MAVETEVERLVVRLMGDMDSFKGMLEQAQQDTTRAAKSIEDAGRKIEGISGRLKGFATTAIAALASLGATTWLKRAFGNFAEAERAEFKLRAALEANGRQVEETMSRYKDFANEVQRITTFEDDQIIALLASAESMGVTGAAAERAVKNAIALEAAGRGSAEAVIRLTAALERGSTRGLERFLRAELSGAEEGKKLQVAMDALAKKFKFAEAEAQTAAGSIKQLQVAFGNLLEDFGAVVAEGLKPVVEWLRQATDWFAALDPAVKKAIVIAIALVAGVTGLITVFSLLAPVLTAVGALVGLVFSPWGIVLAAAAAAVALVVDALGGLEATWGLIKEAAATAWDFLKRKAEEWLAWFTPIWQALHSLFTTTWGILVSAARDAWGFVVKVWEGAVEFFTNIWDRITGGATISWDKIQDVIQRVILFAEFTLQNFGQVAEFAWLTAKLGFIKFAEEVKHFFTGVLPALLNWFKDNWEKVFLGILTFQFEVMQDLVKNTAKVLSNLPDLIKGKVRLEDLWEPLRTGLTDVLATIPQLPARTMGELEKQWQKEWEQTRDRLATDFEEFVLMKRLEFAGPDLFPDETVKEIKKRAEEATAPFPEQIEKAKNELKGFDAALFNSAEAATRVAEFLEFGGRGMAAGGKGGRDGMAPKRFEAAAARSPEAREREDHNAEDILSDIRDLIKEQNRRGVLRIEPAELA